MTGRTHDLAAFAALSYIATVYPVHPVSLATVFVAIGANMIGGLTPDIDQPTADLWRKFPAGSGTIIGRILSPVLGGHRNISHSIIGIVLFGYLSHLFLFGIRGILIVDMEIVWGAFMIGYVSHLLMDLFTHEGVPFLFPVPIKFGIPPFGFLRMKTGGVLEKSVVFPGLLFLTGYIYYMNYSTFLALFRHLAK